jgi:putative transposase
MLVSDQPRKDANMKGKRHTPEQIIRILREVEGGVSVTAICGKHNISEQTFYRWRSKYGNMTVEDARELKHLEEENRRLKSLVADLSLENQMLKEVNAKKW